MTLLKDIAFEFDCEAVEKELEQLGEQLQYLITQSEVLVEEYPQQSEEIVDQLVSAMDVAMKQFAAAKRGLSLISKLTPGENRKKHASRVMSNMNKIRGSIARIQKAINDSMINTEEPGLDGQQQF